MQKEWSLFKITRILYLVVLMLPLSFYFVYTSFNTIKNDTTVVRKSAWISGAIEHITVDRTQQQNIDKALNGISLWTTNNNHSSLYIGSRSLTEDFSQLNTCWETYKKSPTTLNPCYDLSENMAVVIEKMVYMKQKKIINVFYISLLIAMIFALLMIYLVRLYIQQQMKTHAIYDHETTLFNKKYFLTECKSSFARAVRHEYPLSLLQVEIEGFEKDGKQYDKKTKLQTLKAFGTLMHALVRDGDLPARYDENHFLILLPFTDKENALLFENRIRQSLMQDDCIIAEKIKLNFTITEIDKEESQEEFIQRSLAT